MPASSSLYSDKTWITVEEAKTALKEGTGMGIKIAVLDSGIESGHPEFKGKLRLADDCVPLPGYDGQNLLLKGEGKDTSGHGTGVASIIHSLAPEAELGSFRIFENGEPGIAAVVAAAVQEAVKRGYHIINCSFGCPVRERVLQHKRWVDHAWIEGVHVVAAGPNSPVPSGQEWPGAFSSVIAVSAVHTRDDGFFFRGGSLVDFCAMGDRRRVAWRNGGYAEQTGSSFAAPRVTALLARLLSRYPRLTPPAAKAILREIGSIPEK